MSFEHHSSSFIDEHTLNREQAAGMAWSRLLDAPSAILLTTIFQPVSSSHSVDKEPMQSKDIDDIQIKQAGVVHQKGAR